MPAIHWKPEVNALTVPQSYRMRFIPSDHLDTDDIAEGMTEINPALTPDLAKASISALIQTLQKGLINGRHITLGDSLIFSFSFTGRLDSPDDQPPPIEECLHVQIRATANFEQGIHQQSQLERDDMTEKLHRHLPQAAALAPDSEQFRPSQSAGCRHPHWQRGHPKSNVRVTGGTVSADTKLRIQVLQDLTEERLLFSLLDMREGGTAGEEVIVTQNGDFTLPGFAGSAVSTLEITVSNYAGLWELVRNSYGGRLVDVLDVRLGS